MADDTVNPAVAELEAATAQGEAEAADAAKAAQEAVDAQAEAEAKEAAERAAKAKELEKLGKAEAAAGRALAEMKGKGAKPVSANPAAIEWPTDVHQATSELKRAIIEAGARVNGQPDKLEAVLAVMSIGMKHIRARFDQQVQTNEDSRKWHEQKQAERNARTRQHGWQPT